MGASHEASPASNITKQLYRIYINIYIYIYIHIYTYISQAMPAPAITAGETYLKYLGVLMNLRVAAMAHQHLLCAQHVCSIP